MNDLIGKTILHYRILEQIGLGGMGVVYKARDLKLDRFVALKFLPPRLSASDEEKQRFIHEAKAASSLDHPNICTIHEIGESKPAPGEPGEGQMYIAMAFYDGEALKQKIERGPLPIDEALEIAVQVAQGLARAHEADIVHRDIKPANIMITKHGEVKIVDFGLAKAVGRTKLTKEGTTLGTAAYMSPEQTQGIEVDQRTDIWSLGAVLYEMITGQSPFKGEYEQAVMYSIMNEETEPITGLRTGVPLELERIVNKALAKTPQKRYQHVVEMQTDLHSLSRQMESSGEVQPPKFGQEKPSNKRLKAIAVSVGLLFILAVAFFLIRPSLFDEVLISEPKPIAVISFENMTGDSTYDYLQRVIPNLFITSLEQSPYLRVATWERLRDLSKQTGRKDVDIIDKDLGFELCRLDGIHTIVVGSFTRAGEVFVTDVKVLDVDSKHMLKSASAMGDGVASILKSQINEISKEIASGIGLSENKFAATQQPIMEVTTSSIEAYNYYILGREALVKRHVKNVMGFMAKAVALDSTFAIAQSYLSNMAEGLGHVDIARKARRLAKKYAYKATEKERLFLAMNSAESRDEYTKALFELTEKYPKEKRGQEQLLRHYAYRVKDPQKAHEVAERLLQLDPNYSEAYLILGYMYTYMEEYDKGIEYLNKHAALSPGEPNAFDSLGDVYFRMGRLDDAIENYKKAVAIAPTFNAHWRVAYCYALKEEYDEAIHWQTRFIDELQPGSYQFALRGLYYQWVGANRQAFGELAKSSQIADSLQEQYTLYFNERVKAWLHYDQGAFQPGRAAMKRWSEAGKKNASEHASFYETCFRAYLGFISIQEGKLDSAKQHLHQLRTLLPEIESLPPLYHPRPNRYHKLLYAETLLAEDSLAKAITVYQQLAPRRFPGASTNSRINYNFPILKDVLARTYLRMGDLDKAIAEYERLTTFDPKSKFRGLIHPKYHYRLAKVYEQAGQPGKAIARYEKLLAIWKNADADLPELIDAKARLTRLKKMSIK